MTNINKFLDLKHLLKRCTQCFKLQDQSFNYSLTLRCKWAFLFVIFSSSTSVTLGLFLPTLHKACLDKEKSSLFRCFSHRGDEREIANIPRQLFKKLVFQSYCTGYHQKRQLKAKVIKISSKAHNFLYHDTIYQVFVYIHMKRWMQQASLFRTPGASGKSCSTSRPRCTWQAVCFSICLHVERNNPGIVQKCLCLCLRGMPSMRGTDLRVLRKVYHPDSSLRDIYHSHSSPNDSISSRLQS